MSISIKAHKLLKEKFPLTEVFTQYVAKFETRSGRELALEKNRTEAIFLWLQKYDQTIEGVEIKNEKFPGQPYDSKQPRNSNINEKNTPKLKVGKKAFYLQIDNLDALNKVVDWYANL